jgi:phospholipid/cholesterol/gamma-HCH transport system substrate-binding protein
MTPFRERNPVTIGAVGLAVLGLLMLLAFKAEDLPFLGAGDTYSAQFSEAGGLRVDDEVRVAGVSVGKVRDITLESGHVLVTFKVATGTELGADTGASIRVKTVLGAMYLALEPAGAGQLRAGSVIPLARTAAPFDVVDAFSGLARTEQRIDTGQLARSLTTMADLFRDSPQEVRASLTGLSRLSRNVAARDDQLQTLLTNASDLTRVLADRNQSLETLFKDGDVLLRALYARRDAVHNLLLATIDLSHQLTGLVDDSRADLKPALGHLHHVVALLDRRQADLDQSLRLMGPFYRVFANTLGTGPWFDTYIQNMPPIPAMGGGL